MLTGENQRWPVTMMSVPQYMCIAVVTDLDNVISASLSYSSAPHTFALS